MNGQELLDLARPHYGEPAIKRLEQAINFATEAHSGQTRASGEPYIVHPLAVAAILIEWRLDIVSVIAGILHDVSENTDITIAEIAKAFGDDVAFLVDGVTKVSKARSGMGDISSYLPQTKDNLSKLLIAICQDIRVLLIKLADRLHNLRTLEYLDTKRRLKIARESLEVFAPLADRLGMSRVKIEIEEIAFSYLKPKTYRKLKQLLKKRVGRSHKKLEQIKRDISKELAKRKVDFKIDGRIKSIYSLYKKLKKNDIDDIYDLMAIRVIVKNKAQCYLVLGIIHSMYQPMITKIKDYISVPKPNGYQSLHTTVITPQEHIVEIQIRTEQMHNFAERGLAASFFYNEQKLTKNYLKSRSVELPRNLRWILDLQEMAKRLIEDGGDSSVGLRLPVDLFKDRIFVYSPAGDIYDLPEGATPLDFAFAVHTQVGEHAYSARVNNKIAKLNAPLSNGDVVEILTKKNVEPKSGWLDFVKTTKARQRIKAFLHRQETAKAKR